MHNYWIINKQHSLPTQYANWNKCFKTSSKLYWVYEATIVLFPDIRKVSEEIMLTPLIASLNITENVISVIDDVNVMHS